MQWSPTPLHSNPRFNLCTAMRWGRIFLPQTLRQRSPTYVKRGVIPSNTRVQESLRMPICATRDEEHGFMEKYSYLFVFFILLLMGCQSSKVDWDTSVVVSGSSVAAASGEKGKHRVFPIGSGNRHSISCFRPL